MINDAQIRQLIARAIPSIDPSKLEVCMVDYDAAASYLYVAGGRVFQGRTAAIQRTETEIAYELASHLSSQMIADAVDGFKDRPIGGSPYEGKRGKHPKTCTCSKHKAMNGTQ